MLSHHREGSGEPLLLLHGIGSFWRAWRPVVPLLAERHDVIAADLPGFGASAPLPAASTPHPAALAHAVAAFLDDLEIDRAHVAGNSLGGWVALELAKLGRAASVCALSPAGFWNRWERAYSRWALRSTRSAAERLGDHADRLYASPLVRRAAFRTLVAHGERFPAEEAAAGMRALAAAPGWQATLATMGGLHFAGARDVPGDVPVTIAWGEHDRLLLPRQAARARRALPRARHITLTGCGHVPMWDDPGLVSRAILSSTAG